MKELAKRKHHISY